jgi:hypothetical protein
VTGLAAIMSGDSQTKWRHDIDALAFQPEGHRGICVVHRLAFRTLMRLVPTPDACITYFTEQEEAFRASAQAKISRRRLPPGANFHLTSRDLARALTVAK